MLVSEASIPQVLLMMTSFCAAHPRVLAAGGGASLDPDSALVFS